MDNAIFGHSGAGIRTPDRWSTFHHGCSMTTSAAPSQPPSWDRPIVARGPRSIHSPESVRPLARPGRVPTVEEAIAAWLSARQRRIHIGGGTTLLLARHNNICGRPYAP